VSELVAFVFRDPYRAPEVLNELRRRDWSAARDLEDAVAVTINTSGRARIHLSVDPSTFEAARWARLWGCLLGKTLFLPMTQVMVEAVDGVSLSSRSLPEPNVVRSSLSSEAQWWQDTLLLSGDFRRDVAALMVSASSAIFMLLRDGHVDITLQHLRNYGDTIVHTTLSKEQDKKMLAMLAN
jgi:uncharacterized membrane protein